MIASHTAIMLAITLLAALTTTQAPLPASAETLVRDTLHVAAYDSAQSDLNGDGRAEILIYAKDPGHCGSGGCDFYVLSPQGADYRVVLRASVTRPPIRRLATVTHGWRDLGVFVAGGGAQGHEARLRFDGKLYPGNPSMAPAPAKAAQGETLIDAPTRP